jgi:hypothetical protein
MTTKFVKHLILVLAVALLIAAHPRSTSAQATAITENLQFPIVFDVFVPCANGGAGETVSLSGTLHEVFHITFDVNGGVHVKIHDQPQGISGFGQASGAKYQATGVTQQQSNTNPFTFVNNFRIIGQGPGNNFLVHQVFHVTVNANGAVTALFDRPSIECR